MEKMLIAGDSFAADWTIKYDGNGWVNMLSKDFNITNIAQAGVGEYKILKQLETVNVSEYDYLIISHTSAYRIPISEHPIHHKDELHKNCDLIYSDIKEHQDNDLAKVATQFFENLFDCEYAIYIHNLILEKLKIKYPNAINITFFDSFNHYDYIHKFEDVFLNNRGEMNHLNYHGNFILYESIKKIIYG